MRGKGKPKPFPAALQEFLARLTSENESERFPNLGELLAALDQSGAEVSPNTEAWERLLRHVRDHVGLEDAERQSA
jgi:Ser/Thr protein kinase RdoA (MazF antagonist)